MSLAEIDPYPPGFSQWKRPVGEAQKRPSICPIVRAGSFAFDAISHTIRARSGCDIRERSPEGMLYLRRAAGSECGARI